MSHLLYYKTLNQGDSKQIGRLERKLHPSRLCEGGSALGNALANADRHHCNLSFGLYDRARLVGYLIAYVNEKSMVDGGEGHVVYVHDIAVLPAYRGHVRAIIWRLLQQVWAFFPGLPIEAHARGDRLRRWTRPRHMLKPYGYRMTVGPDPPGSSGTESPTILRWEMQAWPRSRFDDKSPLLIDDWNRDIRGDSVGVARIGDPRQWLSLRPVWDHLLRTTRGYTVFQSFDYLWQCWKYLGLSGELCILVVRREDTVIGVAPLAVFPRRIMGRFFRVLGFIGTPWQVDRAQFLFGDDTDVCLDAVLTYLLDHRNLWDLCEFYEQRLDHPTTERMVTRFASAACLTANSGTWPCPYIKTDGGWTGFLPTVARRLRKNLRRSRRMLEQVGEVRLETIDRWPELDDALDSYGEIERKSWKAFKGLGIASDTSSFHFYRNIARVFGAKGEFQLRFLTVGGQRIAGTFGLLFDGVFYSLKIVHDRRFAPSSPGTYLEFLELESCFGNGVSEYDFLGGFLTGKRRWTSDARQTVHQFFYQRRPRLLLFWCMHFVLKRWLRGVLERMGLLSRVGRWLKRLDEITPRSGTVEGRRAKQSDYEPAVRR